MIKQPIIINTYPIDGNQVVLSTNAEDGSYIRWENADGITLSNNDTLTVNALSDDRTYNVYVLSGDGGLSSATTTLDFNVGISNVSKENNTLIVELFNNSCKNASLVVTSVLTGEQEIVKHIEDDTSLCNIDISSLGQGLYIVSFLENGTEINRLKFII